MSEVAIEEVLKYIKSQNYAEAFRALMENLELHPEKSKVVSDLLPFVLHEHTDRLQVEEKYSEIFECYDKVLQQFPKDCELLTELGSRLYK